MTRPFPTAAAAAVALFVAAALAAAEPARATVALRGSVSPAASAQAGALPPVTDTHSDSWMGAGAIRDLSRQASATEGAGTDTVTAHSNIAAHWDSADAGTVTVTNDGWEIVAGDPGVHLVSPVLGAGSAGPYDWAYQFRATSDGRFDLAATFGGFGNSDFGLGDWDIVFTDNAGPPAFTDFLRGYSDFFEGVPISNSFSHDLVEGHTYTVALWNLDGFSTSGDTRLQSQATEEGGQIQWAITSTGGDGGVDGAPEPSTWTLAIAGFGLAGTALRRRGGRRGPGSWRAV